MTASDPSASSFSREELIRYSRQLSLPEFGVEGQRRLANAKVLIVGAGGLGSPAALYLAAAGVGTIGVVEFDRVDASNLHRQILYSSADVGKPKIEVARDRIAAVNPNVTVQSFDVRLTSANALSIMKGFDLVIDASDNFPTRYLVNDAAVMLGIPSIYGSIHRFEGQLSVFGAKDGPCYRCLFRDPPPAGAVPNCAEAGVLGVLPGIVGTLQATEAIKLITGIGDPLIGRLLLIDAAAMSFRTISLRRDPQCPSCGATGSDTLTDYEIVCGAIPVGSFDREQQEEVARDSSGQGGRVAEQSIPSIGPFELAERLARGDDIDLVDVREEYEWEIGHIAGARLVPLGRIRRELGSFGAHAETVVYCEVGLRSMSAAIELAAAGVEGIVNLAGGMARWRQEAGNNIPSH
jgi:sulfur-carrier protein adenylyltransferase/sulfurtransferase